MATTGNPERVRIDTNGNAAQRAFVEADTRETYYFGGVGSGKTTGGVMRLGRHIYEWNPGETLAIVTPTVTMLRNVIIPELQKWGLYDEDWHTSTENRIDYPNGTTVILESAANLQKVERLRGLSIAAAWLDEISQHYAETYYVLDDRLRTGNYRNLFGTGTPKGKNWAYEETVESVRATDHDEWSVEGGTVIQNDHTTTIYGVSTEANRATPEDYKESRKRQHEGHSFKQEVLGEFVEPDGLVYGWFDAEDHVVDEHPEYDRMLYGVDGGFNSPAAALAIADTGDGYHVADEVYLREATADDYADAVGSMVDAFGTGPIYCDPAEPASIEAFRRRGLNAKKAQNDVVPGIQRVTAERHDLTVHTNCRNLRNEFTSYEWKDDSGDDPVKANDHALDSLRYALFSDESGGSAGAAYATNPFA
mgnify:CR=1 FL=1